MRKFILWFFGIAITLVLGMIGAYLLAKQYEEPVRNYIVKQVNARLKSPVHVSDINFSFLERFPSASLVMDDVWAEESIVKMGDPDTLFYFQKVYLNLDVFALIKGNYRINEIEVRGGAAGLLIDSEGYDNYRIWKETEDTTGFLLELDRVHLEDTRITFKNELRRQFYDLTSTDLYFKGSFSKDNYTMAVFGDGIMHDLAIKGTSYLVERTIHVETDLEISAPDDRYAFRKGELTIDDQLDFSVAGMWVDDQVDLRIRGRELDVIRTLSLIPSESRKVFDRYESTGILSFDCTLKGVFSRTTNPELNAEFNLQNAAVSPSEADWKLTGLTGEGRITNGSARNFRTTRIELDNLIGELNGDAFELQGSLQSFDQPKLQGQVSISTDLEGIQALADFEGIEEATGKVMIAANIEAVMEDPSAPKAAEFLNSKASGSIEVRSGEVIRTNDDRIYRIDSATFRLNNNDLNIAQYVGAVNDCKVTLQGDAFGFLGYLFSEDGKLDVKGSVNAGDVNLNELFGSSDNSESGVLVTFPRRESWDLMIQAKRFQLQRFEAEDIKGRLVMTPFKVEARDLTFKSQSGEVNGGIGIFRFDADQIGIRSDFDLKGIDINQLFYSFKDFDQTFVPGRVLSGKLDAEVAFQAFCDERLNINSSSVVSSAALRINDGAITGFQPLIDVAAAIEQKKVLKLFIQTEELRKRLADVQFATLENEISIRDGKVTIPAMQIQSTALNLNINGTHTFDNKIDYAMDFALADVLTLKERAGEYNEYVQEDAEGRTRIFLHIHGTTDEFDVDVERTDIKGQVKEEIKREKETVKGLLKEEFGVFKGDSAQVTPLQEKVDPVRIEFDPEVGISGGVDSTKPKSEPSETLKPKQEEGIFNKLIKKTESDKKKLKEGDFDDDDF